MPFDGVVLRLSCRSRTTTCKIQKSFLNTTTVLTTLLLTSQRLILDSGMLNAALRLRDHMLQFGNETRVACIDSPITTPAPTTTTTTTVPMTTISESTSQLPQAGDHTSLHSRADLNT